MPGGPRAIFTLFREIETLRPTLFAFNLHFVDRGEISGEGKIGRKLELGALDGAIVCEG